VSAVALVDQIACIERALAKRRASYPDFVARKAMTQELADIEIAQMAAALETLRGLVVKPAPAPVQPSLFGGRK
jgi:hypothetical protein